MGLLILLSHLFVAVIISVFLTTLVWATPFIRRLVKLPGQSRISRLYDQTELTDFDREKYADWLWRGLRSIYTSPSLDREHAFDPVHQLVLQQESIVEGLARFYEDYVSESSQLLFRQAIGDVLRNQANSHDAPLPAIIALIRLLGRVRATESLNALVRLIDNESLHARVRATESLIALAPTAGNRPIERQRLEILYETVIVLKTLAPSRDASQAAIDLVNCANFDDGYLFDAIKVLVECEPSHAATIILTLEPRLSRLRQDTLDLGGDKWRAFCEAAEDWAQHIMTVAPVSWIMDLWQEADHRRDQIWLFELIFRNKAKPISLHEDESPDGIFIECEQKLFLRVSDKEYNTMKCIRSILVTKEIFGWIRDPSDEVNHIQVDQVQEREGSISLGALGTCGALVDRNVGLIALIETGC